VVGWLDRRVWAGHPRPLVCRPQQCGEALNQWAEGSPAVRTNADGDPAADGM